MSKREEYLTHELFESRIQSSRTACLLPQATLLSWITLSPCIGKGASLPGAGIPFKDAHWIDCPQMTEKRHKYSLALLEAFQPSCCSWTQKGNFTFRAWPPTLACSCAGGCGELSSQCFMRTTSLTPAHSHSGSTSVFDTAFNTRGQQVSVLYLFFLIQVWTTQLKIFRNFQSLLACMPKPVLGKKWSSWEGLTTFHSTSDTDTNCHP